MPRFKISNRSFPASVCLSTIARVRRTDAHSHIYIYIYISRERETSEAQDLYIYISRERERGRVVSRLKTFPQSAFLGRTETRRLWLLFERETGGRRRGRHRARVGVLGLRRRPRGRRPERCEIQILKRSPPVWARVRLGSFCSSSFLLVWIFRKRIYAGGRRVRGGRFIRRRVCDSRVSGHEFWRYRAIFSIRQGVLHAHELGTGSLVSFSRMVLCVEDRKRDDMPSSSHERSRFSETLFFSRFEPQVETFLRTALARRLCLFFSLSLSQVLYLSWNFSSRISFHSHTLPFKRRCRTVPRSTSCNSTSKAVAARLRDSSRPSGFCGTCCAFVSYREREFERYVSYRAREREFILFERRRSRRRASSRPTRTRAPSLYFPLFPLREVRGVTSRALTLFPTLRRREASFYFEKLVGGNSKTKGIF